MLSNYAQEDKVLLAVDCIIFGFDADELKVLLIKRDFEPEKGKWSLMGGFMKNTENLDQAATRILWTMTGFDDIYMEQLRNYSEVNRDLGERTVSVAYFALINKSTHSESLNNNYGAEWFSLSKYPNLIFDHEQMVQFAIQRLRYVATTKPIGFELLPEKFTMRQLQKLYEAIWGKELDKRNFINKVNALDILEKLDEKDMDSSKKGSFLYKFDKDKYDLKVADNFFFKL
jgi:ADP-ribose pyrophosphatase YjhB (NUDIX family)